MTSKRKLKRVRKAGDADELARLLDPQRVTPPRRQPNGQPARCRQEQRDEAKRTVLEARCRRAGWEPTLENRRRLDLPEGEHALGRAMMAGLIDRPQMEAGLGYAITDAAWRRAKGMPPLWPRAARLEPLPSGEEVDAPEVEARLLAALHALSGYVRRTAGYQAHSAMRAVAVMDADLRAYGDLAPRGLSALVEFYAIGS